MTAHAGEDRPFQRGCRLLFWLYVALVVTLTHWPDLQVPSAGVERTDILVHVGVFGLWALLLLLTRYTGPHERWKSVWIGGVIAAGYAAVDELTQALPGVHRTAAWDDYGANVLGITLACMMWGFAVRPLLAHRNVARADSYQT